VLEAVQEKWKTLTTARGMSGYVTRVCSYKGFFWWDSQGPIAAL